METNLPVNMHFDWYKAWYASRQVKPKLMILIACNGSKAVAIIPLVKQYTKFKGILPWSRISFLGEPEGDWYEPYISEIALSENGSLVAEILKIKSSETILHNIPSESSFLSILKNSSLARFIKPHGKCFYVDTTQAWDDYYQTTSKQYIQQDLRRIKRRLDESKIQVDFIESRFEDITKDMEIMKALHTESQSAQGRTSMFETKEGMDFINSLIHYFAPSNKIRLFFLLFNEQPVSFALNLYFKRKLYYWIIGFKQPFKKYSPSKLLLQAILKQCFKEDTQEFSFMRGDSEYKRKWSSEYRMNYQFKYLNQKGLAGIINRFRSV